MSELPSIFRGYHLFDQQLEHLPLQAQTVISTLNQYSFCMAERDPAFREALTASDVLLPDGVGITLAMKLTTGRNVKKISGSDVHTYLLNRLNRRAGRCFYLGATETTLAKIGNRLAAEYPDIQFASYSPPFKKEFSAQDSEEMIKRINAFKPDVLFVGMTAPKQEKWAHQHKRVIKAPVICSIGAVFDFYAGTVKRPGKVWIDAGLEWFVRLCREPARMWKRYLYYGPVFIYALVKEQLNPELRG